MGTLRELLIKWAAGCADYGSARYQKIRTAQSAIDGLAHELTGNPMYFHAKLHSTPGGQTQSGT